MKNKKYMFALMVLIAGCGGGKDEPNGDTGLKIAGSSLAGISEVVGAGKVEPEKEIISLASPTGGIVKEIYRSAGDSVKKDEPILRLDDEIELIRLSQARNEYLSQKAQLEIEELNLQDSRVNLENSSKLLESSRSLVLKGAETKQSLTDLETEVRRLSIAVEKSEKAVALAEARLKELSDKIRLTDAEADMKILRAPFDGILLDILSRTGSSIAQYEIYAEAAPAGGMMVRTEVDELFAGRIETGLDAEIRITGSDSAAARGKVVFVSPYLKKKSLFTDNASEREDRLVREVHIRLDGRSNLIFNSRVESVIKIKQ